MCGIVGVIAKLGEQVDMNLIARMVDTLRHRGPDSRHVTQLGRCILGHARLSIIDLDTGDQPMGNEDGTIWITFNGEIYNYKELRGVLLSCGHQFRTNSDTEVIVHAYEQYGIRCLDHLRGMFAFAIWDKKHQRLFAAVDRLGQKPFYYTQEGDGIEFAFASEMKALLQIPGLSSELCIEALDQYLALQYVPAPRTILQDVYKLPAAHYLLWERGTIKIQRYWDVDFARKEELSMPEMLEKLDQLLDEAVRLRLVSDVPLGAFLSGGIDSSLVVAYMAKHMAEPVKTFSIGFEEERFNELPFARQVADYFATDHHEFIVRPEAAKIVHELVWYLDEPFADSSAIPSYYVAKIARQYVTVALNGDGGDDSFAGYDRYRRATWLSGYRRIPAFVRRGLVGPLLASVSAFVQDPRLKTLMAWNQATLARSPAHYIQFLTVWPNGERKSLYTDDVRMALRCYMAETELASYFLNHKSLDLVDQMLNCDLHTCLPGDFLVKMDRMSMAHGLEVRSPFLDHHLVEFAAAVPGDVKLKKGQLKHPLRKLASRLLPPNIVSRPKRGFSVPIGKWLRSELCELIQEQLIENSHLIRDGFLRKQPIRTYWREHQEQREDRGRQLWSLLILEMWYRRFVSAPDF